MGSCETPAFALCLGFFGTVVIVAASSVVGVHWLAAPVRYCGRNSLYIYIAFSFPMVAACILGTKLGLFENIDLFAIFVTISAVFGALTMAWLAHKTPMALLFVRPA